MVKFDKYSVKDIIFLAIIAAVLVVIGMLTVPFVLSIQIFGIRSLVTAPFYALICTIAIMKVKKTGSLFIACTINGLVLLAMSPVMFFMQLIGSFLAELITLLIFRSYEKDAAAQLAATLFSPLTLPLSILFNVWLSGFTISDLIGAPGIALLVTAGTILLSIIGGCIGYKVGNDLKKAGKLK